jgi:hypothetical protein
MVKGTLIIKVDGLAEIVNFIKAYGYWFMVRGKFGLK